jgi:hypothetical protein
MMIWFQLVKKIYIKENCFHCNDEFVFHIEF